MVSSRGCFLTTCQLIAPPLGQRFSRAGGSSGRDAAIDEQERSGDVGGFVRGEEGDGASDLRRLGAALQRDVLDVPLQHFRIGYEFTNDRRESKAGYDDVHPYALQSIVDGLHPAEPVHAALARTVGDARGGAS